MGSVGSGRWAGETEPICCSCGSQLPGSGSGWSLGPGILGSEAPSISPVSVVTSRAVNTRGLAHVTRDHGALEHYIGDLCNSQHGQGKLRNVGETWIFYYGYLICLDIQLKIFSPRILVSPVQ